MNHATVNGARFRMLAPLTTLKLISNFNAITMREWTWKRRQETISTTQTHTAELRKGIYRGMEKEARRGGRKAQEGRAWLEECEKRSIASHEQLHSGVQSRFAYLWVDEGVVSTLLCIYFFRPFLFICCVSFLPFPMLSCVSFHLSFNAIDTVYSCKYMLSVLCADQKSDWRKVHIL